MNFKQHFYNLISERAYHGTPHTIEGTFSYDKIGSGHGAQGFGWGFYFAENKSVAQDYVPSSFKEKYQYKGKSGLWWYEHFSNTNDYEKASVWESILLHKSKHQVMRSLDPDETETLKYVQSLPDKLFAQPKGHLYEVELNVEEDKLLNWNILFSEQTPFVQNQLKKFKSQIELGMNYISGGYAFENVTGSRIYHGLQESFSIPKANGGLQHTEYDKYTKPKNASLLLRSINIQGIVYASYDDPNLLKKGSRNIVIFDPKDIKILK